MHMDIYVYKKRLRFRPSCFSSWKMESLWVEETVMGLIVAHTFCTLQGRLGRHMVHREQQPSIVVVHKTRPSHSLHNLPLSLCIQAQTNRHLSLATQRSRLWKQRESLELPNSTQMSPYLERINTPLPSPHSRHLLHSLSTLTMSVCACVFVCVKESERERGWGVGQLIYVTFIQTLCIPVRLPLKSCV